MGRAVVDKIGKTFYWLTVLRQAETLKVGIIRWECRCKCGNITVVKSSHLGRTRSCGCFRRKPIKHGHAQAGNISRTWRSWQHMRTRCLNPNNDSWHLYGGRGIKICDRWLEFSNFLEDMGERPPNTSLDRINGDGNYEPANCRWATPSIQGQNVRTVKLKQQAAEEIRQKYREGKNYTELKDEYKVGLATIYDVIRNTTWTK